jgi:hypothetical protein
MLIARLAGPARFFEEVSACLAEGGSALLLLPATAPTGFSDALEAALDRMGLPLQRYGCVEPSALAGECGSAMDAADWAGHCLNNGGLNAAAHLVDAREPNLWRVWRPHLIEFAQASRNSLRPAWRRPRLCLTVLETEAGATLEAGLDVFAWRARLRKSDVLALVEEMDQPDVAYVVLQRLRRELILSEAGWDLDRVLQLCNSTFAELLRPYSCSKTGSQQRSRIWKAQVSVLFPWIEEVRADLIRHHGDRLRADWWDGAARITSVEELELKHLRDQARKVLRNLALSADLDRLVWLRNELAHLRPVSHAKLISLPERWLRAST